MLGNRSVAHFVWCFTIGVSTTSLSKFTGKSRPEGQGRKETWNTEMPGGREELHRLPCGMCLTLTPICQKMEPGETMHGSIIRIQDLYYRSAFPFSDLMPFEGGAGLSRPSLFQGYSPGLHGHSDRTVGAVLMQMFSRHCHLLVAACLIWGLNSAAQAQPPR